MTSKNRQAEKKRREELILREQGIEPGRPMDDVDMPVYTDEDLIPDKTPTRNTNLAMALMRLASLLIILFSIAVIIPALLPDPEKSHDPLNLVQSSSSALKPVNTEAEKPELHRTGKVIKVASSRGDYLLAISGSGRRSIFPRTYIYLDNYDARYVLPRWLTVFIDEENLLKASNVQISYTPNTTVRHNALGKIYITHSVTALTVDGKVYVSEGLYRTVNILIICTAVLATAFTVWSMAVHLIRRSRN